MNTHETADRRMKLVGLKKFRCGGRTKKGIAELESRMRQRFGENWGEKMIELSNPLVVALCSTIDKMDVRNPIIFFGALRLACERMLANTTAGNENIHEASRRTLGWLPMALTDGEIGELLDEVEFISSLTDEEYQKYLEETD